MATIRIKAVANVQPLEDMAAYLASMEAVVAEETADVVDDYRDDIISELADVPPPVKSPFDFATPKSKRKWFAMVNAGEVNTDGSHYIRQGEPGLGWEVYAVESAIFIENTWEAARYLFGSLAQNASAAARFQVPGHKNTGWQLASPTAAFWIDALQEEIGQRVVERIGDYAEETFGRRAYTSKRR